MGERRRAGCARPWKAAAPGWRVRLRAVGWCPTPPLNGARPPRAAGGAQPLLHLPVGPGPGPQRQLRGRGCACQGERGRGQEGLGEGGGSRGCRTRGAPRCGCLLRLSSGSEKRRGSPGRYACVLACHTCVHRAPLRPPPLAPPLSGAGGHAAAAAGGAGALLAGGCAELRGGLREGGREGEGWRGRGNGWSAGTRVL